MALFSSVLLEAAFLPAAQAATQGQLGTTSTGSFSPTFTAAPAVRYVQITNLADATINKASGSPEARPGKIGVTDAFCVVDTAGSGVTLTVTSAQGWVLREPGGQTLPYGFLVTNPSLSVSFDPPTSGASYVLVIPAANVVTAAQNCGGGTLKKHFWVDSLPATGLTYTDTVTLTVSPN